MSRKSFNLSLQKKRNQIVLSPIIERCEEDGSYVADKVVDYVEKALHYERSVGLSKVQNTYELIKNTLSSQYEQDTPEFEQRVEDVLQTLIMVDGERLSQFISDPARYSSQTSNLPAQENRPTTESQVVNSTQIPLPVHEEVMEDLVGDEKTPVQDTPVEQEANVEVADAGAERRKAREAKNKKRELERIEARSKPQASKPVKKTDVEKDSSDENDSDVIEINESVLRNI